MLIGCYKTLRIRKIKEWILVTGKSQSHQDIIVMAWCLFVNTSNVLFCNSWGYSSNTKCIVTSSTHVLANLNCSTNNLVQQKCYLTLLLQATKLDFAPTWIGLNCWEPVVGVSENSLIVSKSSLYWFLYGHLLLSRCWCFCYILAV